MRPEGVSNMEQEGQQPPRVPQEPAAAAGANVTGRAINPYLLGAGFLAYCEKQGWVISRGEGLKKKYFVTEKGETGLKGFGIKV